MKNKTVSIIAAVIGGGCLIYLLLASFGVTNDFLGWDARNSGWGWKLLTIVLLASATILAVLQATDKIPTSVGLLLATGVLIGLSFVSSTGFKGTAGDIKQRITYLDNQGRVTDTTVLFNCYDGFYHFSADEKLKQYVRDYGELPGRNNWNAYIRSGEIPRSTAPRADENFEWHTGAYEMKIPKGCGK